MKYTIIVLLTTAMLCSCGSNSQTKAIEKSKEIQAAIKPGTVAVSAAGYSMQAKIDGKEWIASSMVPPETAGRIIGYYNDEYIGLPYSKSSLTTGRKIMLGEEEGADLSLNNGCLWKNPRGAIEITKAGAGLAEGTFFFTVVCGSTNEVMSVTDGFFRIAIKK